MNMTLHKISRSELIRQLSNVSDHIAHVSSSVIVVRRDGTRDAIVAVRENDKGVFMYPYRENAPEIAIAPMMGSNMHYMTLEEIIESLKPMHDDDVWLQWPDDNPNTTVGKVFGVCSDGHITVCLINVPNDIEALNDEVRRRCADMGCQRARDGLQCGECEACGSCEVLRTVDDKITCEKEDEK